MLMDNAIKDFVDNSKKDFSIIEEFSALTPRRKVLLCDQLFTEGQQAFYNMVEVLWPQAKTSDIKRLEKFLYSLKNRSH